MLNCVFGEIAARFTDIVLANSPLPRSTCLPSVLRILLLPDWIISLATNDPTRSRKGFIDGRSQGSCSRETSAFADGKIRHTQRLGRFRGNATTVVERRMKYRGSSDIHSRNPIFVQGVQVVRRCWVDRLGERDSPEGPLGYNENAGGLRLLDDTGWGHSSCMAEAVCSNRDVDQQENPLG